jgi:hypothetical protein
MRPVAAHSAYPSTSISRKTSIRISEPDKDAPLLFVFTFEPVTTLPQHADMIVRLVVDDGQGT